LCRAGINIGDGKPWGGHFDRNANDFVFRDRARKQGDHGSFQIRGDVIGIATRSKISKAAIDNEPELPLLDRSGTTVLRKQPFPYCDHAADI